MWFVGFLPVSGVYTVGGIMAELPTTNLSGSVVVGNRIGFSSNLSA